ncbi:Gfo/Idh/MocA family oxidoreductase [Sphingopyxis sp.]|jgi:predicted dehydrogenase|uniref:Gfo/Idh/MocA family protein n=1 Tax=Sphingopyxis sp. TaxID=1908224 RepID=UPI002DF60EA1|nr:Gfo/Idh/MocA family oxidoreductase [Sphingopyxis sp.]
MSIRIALVGLGKISIDQHIPSIAEDRDFYLVAGVSPNSRTDGLAVYPDLGAALSAEDIDAVAVNTPPQLRFDIAREALLAGKHVLLEKPPAGSLSALAELERIARGSGLSLYTGWHSQHAPAVFPARAWLTGKNIREVRMQWCENVREWHPGQRWIWEPGGLGVFDPGINALSILTRILPDSLVLTAARLDVPANCATPIAAALEGRVGNAGQFEATLDFLKEGEQIWSIEVVTDVGTMSLAMGGAELSIAGSRQNIGPSREYPSIYRRFAALVGRGESEVDAAPLALAADAFLIGRQRQVAEFVE